MAPQIPGKEKSPNYPLRITTFLVCVDHILQMVVVLF